MNINKELLFQSFEEASEFTKNPTTFEKKHGITVKKRTMIYDSFDMKSVKDLKSDGSSTFFIFFRNSTTQEIWKFWCPSFNQLINLPIIAGMGIEIDLHNKTIKGACNMTYQEINPTDWKYDKDGDFMEGTLVRVQENVGINDSMLYSIETQEGVKNVWGATILDSRMALVKVGNKIKITYKGLAEAQGGKKPAKIFKVEVDK